MWQNSGFGTRTNSTRPCEWSKRVGLSQVSYDVRLTFFSSAPRTRIHGLAVTAVNEDIRNDPEAVKMPLSGQVLLGNETEHRATYRRTGQTEIIKLQTRPLR